MCIEEGGTCIECVMVGDPLTEGSAHCSMIPELGTDCMGIRLGSGLTLIVVLIMLSCFQMFSCALLRVTIRFLSTWVYGLDSNVFIFL